MEDSQQLLTSAPPSSSPWAVNSSCSQLQCIQVMGRDLLWNPWDTLLSPSTHCHLPSLPDTQHRAVPHLPTSLQSLFHRTVTGTGLERRGESWNGSNLPWPGAGADAEQEGMRLPLPRNTKHQHPPSSLHPPPPPTPGKAEPASFSRLQEVGRDHESHHPHFTDEETEAKEVK